MVYEQLQLSGLVKISDFAQISTPDEEQKKIFGRRPVLRTIPNPIKDKLFNSHLAPDKTKFQTMFIKPGIE